MEPENRLNANTEVLQVRCPECLKLYAVDTAEISEPRPRFACVSCQQKFWVPFPEALDNKEGMLGFPLEWTEKESSVEQPMSKAELSVKPFSCPNCKEPYAAAQVECEKCGVIFAKFSEDKAARSAQASLEARRLWEAAIADYPQFAHHQAFINVCLNEGSLEYALERYSQILAVSPQDENAKKAMLQVQALTVARFESVEPAQTEKGFARFFDYFEAIPLPIRRTRLSTMIMFLCGILIAIGMMVPSMRNLVGLGTSVLGFILALRYYFRVI